MKTLKTSSDIHLDINYLYQVLLAKEVISKDYIEAYNSDFESDKFTDFEAKEHLLRLAQLVKDTMGGRMPQLLKIFLKSKTNKLGYVTELAFLPTRSDDFESLHQESKIQALLEQQNQLGYHDHLKIVEYEAFLESLRIEYTQCSAASLIEEFKFNQKELDKAQIISDKESYQMLSPRIGIQEHNILSVSPAESA